MLTAHTTWARSAATSARDVVPFGVLTIVVCSQSGADFGTRFWKKFEPLAPFGEALHQRRPAAHRAHQRLGEAEVVVDEVELRLAVLGEEHLVGVRDEELVPVDLEGLLVGRGHGVHGSLRPCGASGLIGDRRHSGKVDRPR